MADVPVEIRVQEFIKFHKCIPAFLRSKIHYIPIAANDKRPDVPKGISTRDVRLSFDSAVERIKQGKNVGVMFHLPDVNLFAIDLDRDDEELFNKYRNKFPETLTVRTPSGGLHFYYMAINPTDIRNAVLSVDNKHLGEIRARNYYVVAPGSVVDGKLYTVINERPPKAISVRDLPPEITMQLAVETKNASLPKLTDTQLLNPRLLIAPGTVWSLEDVLAADVQLAALLKVPPDADTPVTVLGKTYPSQSEVDMAILSRLAYWGFTLEQAALVLKAYRYRPKLDREDYIPRTWEKVTDNYRRALQDFDPSVPLSRQGMVQVRIEPPPNAPDVGFTEDFIFDGIPADHFIRKYAEAAKMLTDAYPEYHLGAALFALSAAVNRHVYITLQDTGTPKIWLILVGLSSFARKTTAVEKILFRRLLSRSLPESMRAPSTFSPEGFLSALSENAQMYILSDEISHMFSAFTKAYMAEMREFILQLYDDHRKIIRRLVKKTYEIEYPWLGILGATTPARFERMFTEEDLEDGMFVRFLFLYPTRDKEMRPLTAPPEEAEVAFQNLSLWLQDIYEAFKRQGESAPVLAIFTAEAAKAVNDWQNKMHAYLKNVCSIKEKDVLASLVSRYVVYLAKIATLIRIGRREFYESFVKLILNNADEGILEGQFSAFSVERSDVEIAIQLMDRVFVPYARYAMLQVMSGASESLVERAYMLIRNAGKISRRELLRRLHVRLRDFDEIVQTLLERGDVIQSVEGRRVWYIYVPMEGEKRESGEDKEGDADGAGGSP